MIPGTAQYDSSIITMIAYHMIVVSETAVPAQTEPPETGVSTAGTTHGYAMTSANADIGAKLILSIRPLLTLVTTITNMLE